MKNEQELQQLAHNYNEFIKAQNELAENEFFYCLNCNKIHDLKEKSARYYLCSKCIKKYNAEKQKRYRQRKKIQNE